MTLEETLTQLEALGTDKMRAQNKHGAGENQFGVRLGNLPAGEEDQEQPRVGHGALGDRNIDARLLAILLINTKTLSADEMDRMVRSVTFVHVADWLNCYVVKHHPDKETLRQGWMAADDPMAARAGWSLTTGRVVRSPEGLDLPALLDRIESELGTAARKCSGR